MNYPIPMIHPSDYELVKKRGQEDGKLFRCPLGQVPDDYAIIGWDEYGNSFHDDNGRLLPRFWALARLSHVKVGG